ncbi:hypothetical protein AMECASPLE_006993 [Ameca splendens]|uniref:Uncharacterized protein n=1 Tax=Ameca splendens TaxID=208324 RepID=A0ABV1A6W9_9TELE
MRRGFTPAPTPHPRLCHGEWKGSGVQAVCSAGGRLSEGRKLEEEEEEEDEGGGLLGWQNCKNIVSHYPESVSTPVIYRQARRGKAQAALRPPYLHNPATAASV